MMLDGRQLEIEINNITEKKGLPGIVADTAWGTIMDSSNQEKTYEKVLKVLNEETEARTIIKKLQPIIREEMAKKAAE